MASGEYGDLNPVLFEAVQGGMCASGEKKNPSESNGQSVCAAKCLEVRRSGSSSSCSNSSSRAVLDYLW